MEKYTIINGKRYVRTLIELAENAYQGNSSHSIDINVAKILLDNITADGRFTHLEKRTLGYIRSNYVFTEEANTLLLSKLKEWCVKRSHEPQEITDVQEFDCFRNEDNDHCYESLEEFINSIGEENLDYYLGIHACDFLRYLEVSKLDGHSDFQIGHTDWQHILQAHDGKYYGYVLREWHHETEVLIPWQEFTFQQRTIVISEYTPINDSYVPF